jgi:hypothetical protein
VIVRFAYLNTAAWVTCFAFAGSLNAQERWPPLDFQGSAVVALSDADMVASAYVDGQLGPIEGQDTLSVLPLGGDLRRTQPGTVVASNSVAGPPSAVAATPDGRFAVVVETFANRPEGKRTFADLKPGTKLTLIDISTTTSPRTVHSIDIGTRPTSVAVSPDGSLVAVVFHPADGRQLALVPLRDGRFGEPVHVGLPGVAKDLETPHVDWHPSGRYLATTIFGRNEVAFFAIDRSAAQPSIRPWGKPVQVSKYPMMGRFTPDGRHFVNVNLYWGDDVEGFWITAPRGDVTVTRFDENEDASDPKHSVVSRAETGVSPEGMSISADGRRIVTANLERSYLPYADPRITWYSSLSLLSLDPQWGKLTSHGESYFDGILPEAAVFDASGKYVAAVTFDHFDESKPGGSIDFWRVVDDTTSNGPRLVRTQNSVPVARGPHSLVLVK